MSHQEDQQLLSEKTHLCWKIGEVFAYIGVTYPLFSALITSNLEIIGTNIWTAVGIHPNQDLTYSLDDYRRLTQMFEADIATYANDFIAYFQQRPEDTDRSNLGPAVQSCVLEWLRKAHIRG